MRSSSVPKRFSFLVKVGEMLRDNVRLGGEPLTPIDVALVYDSTMGSRISFAAEAAQICLNVRFVEAVLDLISCLRLVDSRACGARSFLVVYGFAIDLGYSGANDDLFLGMVQDYVVSRATAEFEIPDATSREIDLSGDDFRGIGELVALYISLHEITHWKLAHDSDFRAWALGQIRRYIGSAVASKVGGRNFRQILKEMNKEIGTLSDSGPFPLQQEEWICDMVAAEAINRAVKEPTAKVSAEVVVSASNTLLWARARLRRIMRRDIRSLDHIDRELLWKRGSIAALSSLTHRYVEWGGGPTLPPHNPFIDRLHDVANRSLEGFVDARNIARLEAIGQVSRTFDLVNIQTATAAVARMQGWE